MKTKLSLPTFPINAFPPINEGEKLEFNTNRDFIKNFAYNSNLIDRHENQIILKI